MASAAACSPWQDSSPHAALLPRHLLRAPTDCPRSSLRQWKLGPAILPAAVRGGEAQVARMTIGVRCACAFRLRRCLPRRVSAAGMSNRSGLCAAAPPYGRAVLCNMAATTLASRSPSWCAAFTGEYAAATCAQRRSRCNFKLDDAGAQSSSLEYLIARPRTRSAGYLAAFLAILSCTACSRSTSSTSARRST